MKPKSVLRRRFLTSIFSSAFLVVVSNPHSHAAETIVDSAVGDVSVSVGDTVWFDSANTNAPIPLATINGSAPAVGPLPGWAHTRWSFLKYDGANVVEVPQSEKVVGAANLPSAGPASIYETVTSDEAAISTITADQSIGLVETTRDFVINDGATLNVTRGGLIFHNASHWVKTDSGDGFITSSSGQLVAVANGGSPDYQINGTVVRDFDGSTPLAFVKTGTDTLGLTSANTYTGGTWVNNGRLQANGTAAFGTGTVRVTGDTSQAYLTAAGNYANAFAIRGLGPLEGAVNHGAVRLADGANITGTVTLDGSARISVNSGATATISGPLAGIDQDHLEINSDATGGLNGTLNLDGLSNAFGGSINLLKGGLAVNNVLGDGLIFLWLEDDATLSGEGIIAGDLGIGGAGLGSRLVFDASTAGALHVQGDVDLSTGVTHISSLTAPPADDQPVTVFTYGGSLDGDISNISATALRDGVITHDVANKRVLVTFTFGQEDLLWTGAETSTWAADGALNFHNGVEPLSFIDGDNVTFDDSATPKVVDLGGLVSPASIVVDNTEDYTITGTGGIGGDTGLTKSGGGRLILGGEASTFTGPIDVADSRLQLAHGAALGFASGITLQDGAQFDFAGFTPDTVGRSYSFTMAGVGPDGNGALTNSGGGIVIAGVDAITLTGDASVGAAARFDLGLRGGASVLNGNGHTLTKIGNNDMGFRFNAGGSPIDFVIASGRVWGEDTDLAFGGTNGTLTVLTGAQVSTYGSRTIATPVFLQSGATLYNQGGGTGTWTGTINVEGIAVIGAGNPDGSPMLITGPMTGAGGIIKAGGQNVTIASPGYEGNTTVSVGTLALGAATLTDHSIVHLETGTILRLEHLEIDDIGTLILAGVAQPEGTYGSSASGAEFPNDTFFSGPGILRISATGGGEELVWTGDETSEWAADGALNFISNGVATAFSHGDHVTFDDSAEWKDVTLGSVIPGSVLFDHDDDYQLTGTGGMSGPGSFTKRGSGRLILGGQTSDFAGPVLIEEGTVQLAHASALGFTSGVTVESGGQLDFAGSAPNRNYNFTIAGDGPDGMGALTSSMAPGINQNAGIHMLTLSADASVGGTQRFDLGRGGADSILTGNGHTLTKVGPNGMGFRCVTSGVVHIVIAEGSVWGENNDSSLGGTLGTVTVKSGARLGTYGPRIIPTPVTLESGATLYNEGNALGTWTGPVSIQGEVTLHSASANSPVHVTGPMSGAGNVTKTGGQDILIAAPGYVGNTTVASGGGTLILGAPTLANSSTVSLASGARLELTYQGTDVIGSLVLGGDVQSEGTYGSSASSAQNPNDTYFSGTGVLQVGGEVGGAYGTWAATNGIAGASPNVDSDGDTVLNGIEFVVGGNPDGGNSLPLLPVSAVNGDYLDFVFRRTAESASYSPRAEYGSTLTGWTPAQAGVNGVIIVEDANHFGPGIDRVTVRIPRSLAIGGIIFARLTVNIQ